MTPDEIKQYNLETEIERLTAAEALRNEADVMRAKLADDREAGHLAEIERLKTDYDLLKGDYNSLRADHEYLRRWKEAEEKKQRNRL